MWIRPWWCWRVVDAVPGVSTIPVTVLSMPSPWLGCQAQSRCSQLSRFLLQLPALNTKSGRLGSSSNSLELTTQHMATP